MTQVTDEQAALAAFEASQHKRRTIGIAIAGLVVATFVSLKLYQAHMKSELQKPIVIETKLKTANGIIVP